MAAPITNPNALKPAGNDDQLIKELKVLETFYYRVLILKIQSIVIY